MRVTWRMLSWSSTTRTLRPAATGILATPYFVCPTFGRTPFPALTRFGGLRADAPRYRRASRFVVGQLRQLVDIDNERDAPIAENCGSGNSRDPAVILLDALDHDL